MLKFFVFSFLFFNSMDLSAAVVKLGEMQSKGSMSSTRVTPKVVEISCFSNDDCSYSQECVALRCEDVCKHSTCEKGTYCGPAGKENPHQFGCYECTQNWHCTDGKYCDENFTCQKPDPCINAICSPAAPFCYPEPFQTLPYTCVQCLEQEHCPPIAGLTRSCIKGYCLFNVEGNIPEEYLETDSTDTTLE